MPEEFLYFIWKYRLFNAANLQLVTGENLIVQKTGLLNQDSGPDFSGGQVIIDGISWYGNIEMHINSSEWEAHKHQLDIAYNNVILHVVWEHDKEILRADKTAIPTLELKNYVDHKIICNYRKLREALEPVPCLRHIDEIEAVRWYSMIDRSAVSRLKEKANSILELLELNKGDWEQTSYQLLMKYFGFKVNEVPMELLAKAIPFSVLKKNSGKPYTIEALLFGHGGFLKQDETEYQASLRKEYAFNKKKYSLGNPLGEHLWKFLRMRPANFPTLRIAQISVIIRNNPHLFDLLLREKDMQTIIKKMRYPLHPFWQHHYHFMKTAPKYDPVIGLQALHLAAINVIAPLRAAYSVFTDDQSFMDDAVSLLNQLPLEKNKIVNTYKAFGFKKKSAFDSQGMIGLYSMYCSQKACLNCDIGIDLVRT